MGLRELIRDSIEKTPSAGANAIAAAMVASMDIAELTALLAEEVEHVMRQDVRSVEGEAFRAFFANGTGGAVVADPTQYAALFRSRFALGDGTLATWGAATVEQHKARIALLEVQIEGLKATVERHKWAVQTIEKSRAECLEGALAVVVTP